MEELHRSTVRMHWTAQELQRQSSQVNSPWCLSAYLLSVHRMSCLKRCFSSPLSHHLVDLPGGHRILPELLSAGIPAFISRLGNYSSQWMLKCIGKKSYLPCRFWTVRTSDSACGIYLFACFKKNWEWLCELLWPLKCILQNIHVYHCGYEIQIPY